MGWRGSGSWQATGDSGILINAIKKMKRDNASERDWDRLLQTQLLKDLRVKEELTLQRCGEGFPNRGSKQDTAWVCGEREKGKKRCRGGSGLWTSPFLVVWRTDCRRCGGSRETSLRPERRWELRPGAGRRGEKEGSTVGSGGGNS